MSASSPRAAFRHRPFRLYAASTLLSNVGMQVLAVAVGWQVYAKTHAALALGLVGLAGFVPALVVSLPAGQLADRVDRARLVAAAHLAFAACALVLLAITAIGGPSVAPIYAVLVVAGVARAIEAPAGHALAAGLVPAEDFGSAVAWGSAIWQIATILGPALGGVLYGAAGGAMACYGAAAALVTVASGFAFALPSAAASEPPAGSAISRIVEGLRFVASRPILLESISIDLFAVLLGGATALLPVYASDVLHVGPRGLGLLRSAPAVGAAAMAVLLGYRPLSRRAGPVMLACVGLFGVATIVFGASRSFPLSLGALVVLGASDMVSVVVRGTVVQLRTPDGMRGRVGAVSMMFVATSSDLGELESGLTAAWLGAVPAVIAGGVGTLVVVLAFAVFGRALRGVDRLDETA